MSRFNAPAKAEGIPWADLKGCLLIVDATEKVTDINTAFGPSDAVKATVTVVDGTKAGTKYVDTLVFPKVLQSQLVVGQLTLGRLGQGQAKPGQSAPWMLAEASAEDVAKAEAVLEKAENPAVTADGLI